MALLKFKRSAVPAKIPSIADLALGELAINTYDGKVYTKKDDGTASIVEVGGNSNGITTITSTDGSVTVTGSGATRDLSVAVAGSTTNVLALVRNNTGATLAKGTVVYINGSLGQNSTVAKALATGDATSAQTLGLMTANLANNATGYVTVIGGITNIDTSAFTDGQQLYLSPTTAGTFTATKPYAPQHLVYVAVVEHAHPSQGKLFVKVQNGYEMDELHNVSAQSPANNDGLFFNTTTSLWEKKSIATVLGYTPYNASNPAGYTTNVGTVTSVSGTGTVSGLTLTGSVTSTGSLTLGGTLSLTSLNVTGALGFTPYNATNPSGYTANTGTVTSVGGTGTVSGLTLTGSVTTAGSLTLGGTLSLTSGNVTTALGYTPYNATNPSGYITSSALSSYLPLSGGTLTGALTVPANSGTTGGGIAFGGAGSTFIRGTSGDGASSTTSNLQLQSWFGIGFGPSITGQTVPVGENAVWIDTRLGDLSARRIITGLSDVRAPIFYDSNNTAYYIDPASTSALNGLNVASNTPTFSSSSFQYHYHQSPHIAYVKKTGGYSWYWRRNDTGLGGGANEIEDMSLTEDGNLFARSSVRAPIFYDSNDTGYYINPNSDSNFSRLSSYIAARDANANWNTGFTNTPAYSYNYHGDLNGGTNAPATGWWFYESMRHSNATNYWGTQLAWGWEDNATRLWQRNVSGGSFGSWVEYLNTSNRTYTGNLNMTGSIISTASDVRAPIFYDQNNTGYYVNPNGTSNLSVLNIGTAVSGASYLNINGYNAYGGTGYHGFLTVNNTYGSATNPNQYWRLNSAGGFEIVNSPYNAVLFTFTQGGDFTAAGNVTAYSDRKLKTNFEPIANAVNKVLQLNGVTFTRIDKENKTMRYAGLVAQDVENVLPEAVQKNDTISYGEILSVDYNATIALLVEAIKELKSEIDTLKSKRI